MKELDKFYRQYLLKKISIVLIIALIGFIFIELFSRWVAATSTAYFGSRLDFDQKMLVADSVNGGVVAIGDSIIARSFYPELFSAALSEKLSISYPSYNLGVTGANLNEQIATLRHLLKRKVKPSLVVIDVPIHALNVNNYYTYDPDTVKHPLQFWDNNSADYYTRCEVNQQIAVSTKIYCQLAQKFYFIRMLSYYHHQILTGGKNLLHTQNQRFSNLITYYPVVSYMGFSPIFNVLNHKTAHTDFLYQAMINTYANDYKVYKLGADRYDQLIDECNKNSVNVVLVLMPLYQPVMRKVHDHFLLPDNKTIANALDKYAKEKNIGFVNLFEELQAPEYFQDPVHLNVDGAVQITKLLAKKLLSKDFTYPEGYLDSDFYQYMQTEEENKS
ncbi:DUF1574 family protein [Legionella quateirensis]|uniref:GDSL-like Lipase/Acylhydrolase n=1 Tax=Legionella quateirensis TaxID=45072 RepID=A0A378KYP4_9GAMM|nr:DUF1574 family protein [Legionella quateirensis]KTD44871.1 GDSL-like Lipase/Acylhydrolase [Legionella quateirensis]STY19506.1 GDSL-like Lipase/Acylhydrolase [Legionella quateirensis]